MFWDIFCRFYTYQDEGVWVNDELVCQDCFDENYVVCDQCDDAVWHNDAVEDENTTLCQSCFDAYYSRCECCGTILHHNFINWRHDLPYCESCFDDFADEIEEYSYKPEPIFYGDGNLFMGVELEVDEGGKDDENALHLKKSPILAMNTFTSSLDGSLEDGFEIVSHPMTLDYHMKQMDWGGCFERSCQYGLPLSSDFYLWTSCSCEP